MKKELDKQLCEKYALIFKDWHENMQNTAMCWGFDCGDGWYKTLCSVHAKEQGRGDAKK